VLKPPSAALLLEEEDEVHAPPGLPAALALDTKQGARILALRGPGMAPASDALDYGADHLHTTTFVQTFLVLQKTAIFLFLL
jgi:hypothetical protein